MPTYGAAKRLDIQRSVLPSTMRKTAREMRREAHHRARAATREAIAHGREDRPEKARKGDINMMVADRRSGDKLGPVKRWSKARTAHLPADEQFDFLRPLFPDNTIGRHALFSHIRYYVGPEARDYVAQNRERNAEWRAKRDAEQAVMIAGLRRVIASGFHRQFNDAMKQATPVPFGRVWQQWGNNPTHGWWSNRAAEKPREDGTRLLMGVHDCEAFTRDVWGYPYLRRQANEALARL